MHLLSIIIVFRTVTIRVSFSTNTAAVLKNITPLIILVFPYHVVYLLLANIAVSIMTSSVSVCMVPMNDLLQVLLRVQTCLRERVVMGKFKVQLSKRGTDLMTWLYFNVYHYVSIITPQQEKELNCVVQCNCQARGSSGVFVLCRCTQPNTI